MDNVPISIVEHILGFISFEVLITLFPENKNNYDRNKHNFDWWSSLAPVYRVPVLNWFIYAEKFPIDIGDDNTHLLDILASNSLYKHQFKVIVSQHLYKLSGFSHKLVDWCSSSGNIDILQWWYDKCMEKNLSFVYTAAAIDGASYKGHLNILDWWKSKRLVFKYTRNALDKTYDIRVLEWWRNSTLPLVYSTRNIDHCTKRNILDWWLDMYIQNDFRLKYKNWSIINASSNNRLDILNWWFDNRFLLKMKYDERAIDYASERGHLDVLNWWLDKHIRFKLPFKYTSHAVDFASCNGHVHVLEWWLDKHKSGLLYLKRTADAVNMAVYYNRLDVLDFWMFVSKNSKLAFIYNRHYVDKCLDCSQQMLSWWKQKTKKNR